MLSSFSQYISHCSKGGNVDRAKSEWDLIVSRGYVPTDRNIKQLVHAFAFCRDWLSSTRLIIESISPSPSTPSIESSNPPLLSTDAALAVAHSPATTPNLSASEAIIYLLNLVTQANSNDAPSTWPSGGPSHETILEMRNILTEAYGPDIWSKVSDTLQSEVESERKRLEAKKKESEENESSGRRP